MAGLKPKEEDIIVRTSKDGIIRKTIRNWFCSQPRKRFIIPLFQRRYLWGRTQCRKFLEDGLNASFEKLHDIGTVMVYVNDKNETVIVDGQQRATTLLILFASLRKRGADVRKVLFHKGTPILHPTYHDQVPFSSVIENKTPVGESNIIQASSWFDSWTAILTHDEINKLTKNLLDYFTVLEFTIPQGDDSENLQVIYERLVFRSIGIATLMFISRPGITNGVLDLTRNLILSYYSENEAISIYHSHWMPLELLVAENDPVYSEGAELRFGLRLKSFLGLKTWELLPHEKKQQQNRGAYLAFKRYTENEKCSENKSLVTSLIQELLDHQTPKDIK